LTEEADPGKIERIRQAVTEYKQGKRVLIISGSFHENQGFTLGLATPEHLPIYGVGRGG
jgi:hypothetical protein